MSDTIQTHLTKAERLIEEFVEVEIDSHSTDTNLLDLAKKHIGAVHSLVNPVKVERSAINQESSLAPMLNKLADRSSFQPMIREPAGRSNQRDRETARLGRRPGVKKGESPMSAEDCANCRHSSKQHSGSRSCGAWGCSCARFLAPERLPFEVGDRVRFKGADGVIAGLVVHSLELIDPNSGARWYRVAAVSTDQRVHARIEAAAQHFEAEDVARQKLNRSVRIGILAGICIVGPTSPIAEKLFTVLQQVWNIPQDEYLHLSQEIADEIGIDLG